MVRASEMYFLRKVVDRTRFLHRKRAAPEEAPKTQDVTQKQPGQCAFHWCMSPRASPSPSPVHESRLIFTAAAKRPRKQQCRHLSF